MGFLYTERLPDQVPVKAVTADRERWRKRTFLLEMKPLCLWGNFVFQSYSRPRQRAEWMWSRHRADPRNHLIGKATTAGIAQEGSREQNGASHQVPGRRMGC